MRLAPAFIAIVAALLVTLTGCESESNPVHRVNDKLLASASELGDEIEKEIERHVEATQSLLSCEKHAKNAATQCGERRVALARSAARLCGLQTQRVVLHKIMENNGDARGVKVSEGDACDLK